MVLYRLHDIVRHEALKSCLLSGNINETCSWYAELNTDLLRVEPEMFRRQFEYSTIDDAAQILWRSVTEMQKLFQQAEVLPRLLVIPVASWESERSFSSFRRLKTWLRSTMTQKRLNNVAMCSVHHNYIDQLNSKDLVNQLVCSSERWQHVWKMSGGMLAWLSGMRCRLAYSPADATATHYFLLQ